MFKKIPSVWINPLKSHAHNLKRLEEAFNQKGDVLQIKGMGIRLFGFRDPQDIQQIYTQGTHKPSKLLANMKAAMGRGITAQAGGPDWLARRRVVSQGFRVQENKQKLNPLSIPLAKLERRWFQKSRTQDVLDLQSEIDMVIADHAFRAFFNLNIEKQAPQLARTFHFVMDNILNPVPLWIPTPKNRRFKRNVKILRRLMYTAVLKRPHEKNPPDDVLKVLMDHFSNVNDVIDQMFAVFMGAMVQTTSITWTIHHIMQSPTTENNLLAEIKNVLGDQPINFNDLSKMQLPAMIFNETIRLYPPAWISPRVCPADVKINQHRFKKGTFLVPMIYLMQRHPQFWTQPHKFNPERFAQTKTNPAFKPFGGGSRMCPGAFLAPLIAQMVLVSLIQKFHLTPIQNSNHIVKPSFKFELATSERIHIRVHARKQVEKEKTYERINNS